MKVKLIDGPYEGVEVDAKGTGSILMGGELPNGEELPQKKVARYRPTRTKGEWRFKGWDEVTATLALPGREAA